MAKGNYIALQALKPTELKVADYYKSFADDLIKRGDSDRAARAKMLEDKRKEVGAIFTDMKVDPFATISQASDLSTQSFIDTAQYVGQQRMLAEQDPANAYKYIQNAKRAHDDYRVLATTFGNKDFIDKANTKAQALASNDTFGTTDNNARLALLNQQMPIMKRNLQTGKMEFYLPKNESANPDEPMVGYSIGEIGSLFTSPDEINLLRSNKSNGNNGFMDKQIYDVAKLMSDEYSRNFDGNRTNAKTWFSAERGNQWFDTNFGVYNPNRVNPIVSQYARETLGRDISSEEDFNIAKQGIIGNIASLVGTETKVDTKDSALDIALKNKRLEALNESIKASRRSGQGSGSEKAPNYSALEGVSVIRKTPNGSQNYGEATIFNLKNKEYVAGFKVPNSNGKGFHTEYANVGRDKYGRLSFEKTTTRGDALSKMKGYGLDPNYVESRILDGKQTNVSKLDKQQIGDIKYDKVYKEDNEPQGGGGVSGINLDGI